MEFALTFLTMLSCSILTLGLLLHMIDLQGEDTQTVHGPRRTLRIDTGIWQHFHFSIFLTEITVNLFHQIRTVLIGTVNTALQLQSLNRVDMWVTYDILKMPLNGINPAFQI